MLVIYFILLYYIYYIQNNLKRLILELATYNIYLNIIYKNEKWKQNYIYKGKNNYKKL